jgi:hypothetical protein
MSSFDRPQDTREPIVSFANTARRMRRFARVLAALLVTVVAIRALGGGGVSMQLVGETFGLVLLVALFGEMVIVGSAAVTGARRAARQGERLSRADVALIPPQVIRRLNRRFNAPGHPDRF